MESTTKRHRSGSSETAITISLPTAVYRELNALAATHDKGIDEFLRALLEREVGERRREEPTALDAAVRRMTRRTTDEIEETRASILSAARPARPLPQGRSWLDVISGQWPGNETDQQINAALDELS